jgi:2-haloacid dehalogenase
MIKNIIFDLGGVLIDWNPNYMYRKVFHTEEAVGYFINNICTNHWNEQQDGGRSIKQAEEILINQYPEYKREILMYYDRWTEMLGGAIDETVDIFKELKNVYPDSIFALTNWSAETWPTALTIFDFLHWFNGVVVSGQENMKKPDERIFKLICDRYRIVPTETIFIDDNINNITAAKSFGLNTIHFRSSEELRIELMKLNLIR